MNYVWQVFVFGEKKTMIYVKIFIFTNFLN